MYVNENMSGVYNVLGVMKAKHYIYFLSPFNEDEAVRVKNLFTQIIPLPPL
jgi:hypothetical protein